MDTAGLIPALALALAGLAAMPSLQPAPEGGASTPASAQPSTPGAAGPAGQSETGAAGAPAVPNPNSTAATSAPDVLPAARCDAASWRWLRGRSLNELLSTRLPDGSRIVRVGDAPLPAEAIRGRLVVEVGRNTRVRRVFCG